MIQQIARAAKNSYTEVTWDLDFDTQATVSVLKGTRNIIIAVRGTEKDIDDIKTDFDFTWADMNLFLSDAMAHHGFFQAAKAVADKIYEEIYHSSNRFLYGIDDIVLTGHSLVGAVATLAAVILKNQGLDEVRVVTFGSPRPGDKALKKWVKKEGLEVTRYVNSMDAVTAMPFWVWGYRHIGELIYLTEDEIHIKPKWWHRLWLRLRSRREILGAHSMDLYLERVSR
jgi:predicted lipase